MFEHSLIGLQERKKSRRGWFSLPMAVLIHLVALGTFAFASYWDVGEVPEPSLNVVFFTQAPAPPPPIRGSGEQPATAVKPVDVKPVPAPPVDQPIQPDDVPDDVPQADTSSVVSAVAGLPPGGHPDGVDEGGAEGGDPLFGVSFSAGDGGPGINAVIGTPSPAPVVDDAPIQVGGAVKRPEPIHQPQPRYTEVARRANVQGVVVLQATIDERGNVTDVRVLRGLPMGLDQAAIDAVRMWRYKPATLHGRPVKVYFSLTVNFQLQR